MADISFAMIENVMYTKMDTVFDGNERIIMIDKNCGCESIIIDGY